MSQSNSTVQLSVVIPAYQAARTLDACLGAVVAALPAEAELLVIDDGSTDETADIAERHPSKVYRHKENRGQIAARKTGVENSSGDIIVFVDADVVVEPTTFEQIVQHFAKHPEVAAVTGRLAVPKSLNSFCGIYKSIYMNAIFEQLPNRCSFLYGALHALRRSAFRLINPVYQGVEDNVLGFLLRREGLAVELLKDIQVEHLKEYSLAELLQNDFSVARKWALLFWSTQAWRTVFGQGFLHSPRWQLFAIITLGFSLIAVPFSCGLASIALLLWLLLNGSLFAALLSHQGFVFTLRGIALTLVDQFVQGMGILAGSLYYAKQRFSKAELAAFSLEQPE